MKRYHIVVHYQDGIFSIDANSEDEAMEKAEQLAYHTIEINGMEVHETSTKPEN